ncbi:MAG: gamma-glutamyl-gamma-aminobutyrate hydrolase family protein, partial [Clostridia bacterium]|nr:gamma-glutamyl-gamma-aminobutyrate hydrolase family protein [Clostridia bacterium]
MLAIIDYGVGNLFSIKSSFARVGVDAVVTSDKKIIQNADRVMLPGVGAFRDAANKLHETGLGELVKEEVKKGKPVMGICLGMQMLF